MLSGQKGESLSRKHGSSVHDTGKFTGLILYLQLSDSERTELCFQKDMRKKFTHILWRLP